MEEIYELLRAHIERRSQIAGGEVLKTIYRELVKVNPSFAIHILAFAIVPETACGCPGGRIARCEALRQRTHTGRSEGWTGRRIQSGAKWRRV